MNVAIIGTAGRDKGKTYTLNLWCAMYEHAEKMFSADKDYHLVSGGAAWADHLAVELYLSGRVASLKLHLPAPFEKHKFIGPASSSATAANYYHEMFTKTTGIDSRMQITEAIKQGAEVTYQPQAKGYGAMFERNLLVAAYAEACLAYTWGTGKEPADGGTKFTWDKIVGRKVHIPLDTLVH